MPEQLKASEVNSKTDPSVAKQYDEETPKDQQIKEFFQLVDGKKICMLNTFRDGVGPVGRSMALARRDGPNLLFLSNTHSQKFSDLAQNKQVQVTIQDTKSQDWASITGTATTCSNSDPRIKEVWSRGAAAWFGDLGDGVHDGGPDDPRMALIEVKSEYVVYYLAETGVLGYVKEVVVANVGGGVAKTGALREIKGGDLERARSM
ncbi:hypothetical protein COCMIDRAFT_83880 [Bipolaris oryzae ATCC 44560]|uniref:General stress protein FMN-binding split barrel domain-containing protein n=1 Tax=Bipolaris oryzae ATCC 44560 TaxID=930090 RepID=W7A0W9_COCMI|nr:uncharacterized protein COCMIDRAFT_83880 [Bipolaris oryzae ATCC 44560]EUC49691.1 hypothetical protein COCMIDRAFT_83880 [Bipolaris oryzae ATCC 44560]